MPVLNPSKLVIALLVCLLPMASFAAKTSWNLDANYAQTSWPAGHRDSSNTDHIPIVSSRTNRISRHLLPGHPVFWAPTSGPEGHFYVTSGKGQGGSNLHAFDGNGELLWKSKPQDTLDDLDGWAIINAPIVADDGDVYVGDQNQLWAFRPDGTIKWVTELTQYGVTYGFMTAVISRQGYIGGISSNGKVIFLNAEDGTLAMPVLDLPGGDGPPAGDTPPDTLWQGLMDPALKPVMFNLIQGWAMEVANTPAVHPETGRVYITAYGVEPGTGLLYGIDVFDDRMEIAFQTSMGQGSGTSPAISHDGRQVYALDELGHLLAIDAVTGRQIWKSTEKGGGAASPTVGPDEVIYSPFHDHLIGFNYDGSLKFHKSYNQYCADRIDPPGWFWGLILSEPVAFLDSLFTADADNTGWLNIVCGYHIKLQASDSERTLVPIPVSSNLVAVRLDNGEPFNSGLLIPETSEGFIVPTLNGNQFVTLSGAISSIYYHLLNPYLPGRFEVPYAPRAGVLLLEPESREELLVSGIEWLLRQQATAARLFAGGEPQQAHALLQSCTLQLASSLATLDRIAADGGLSPEMAQVAMGQLKQLEAMLLEDAGVSGRQLETMRDLLQGVKQSLGRP